VLALNEKQTFIAEKQSFPTTNAFPGKDNENLATFQSVCVVQWTIVGVKEPSSFN
jgi:hypothetical protein